MVKLTAQGAVFNCVRDFSLLLEEPGIFYQEVSLVSGVTQGPKLISNLPLSIVNEFLNHLWWGATVVSSQYNCLCRRKGVYSSKMLSLERTSDQSQVPVRCLSKD